jgi:hypothetical protein
LPIDQLLITNNARIINTEEKSRITLTNKSSVFTGNGVLEKLIISNQGSPKHIRMSKILDPTALLSAIPPLPCFATITEDIKSGTEVPIAKTVNAITTFGIFSISEIITALSTSTQLSSAITIIEIKKTP